MPVLTLYYRDKFYEEGSIPPEGKEIGDRVAPASMQMGGWGIESGAIVAELSPSVIAVFPLDTLETAVVMLETEEGADAVPVSEETSEESADPSDAGAEGGSAIPGGVDLGGGSEAGEGS